MSKYDNMDGQRIGKGYEKFIIKLLAKERGVYLHMLHGTSQYIGETREGFEVKYQHLMKDTRNLWIEMYEKSHARNREWIRSGVYKRPDNTHTWITGDYKVVYFFWKKHLAQKAKVLEAIAVSKIKTNKFGTSKGYLLTVEQAEQYAYDKIEVKEELCG